MVSPALEMGETAILGSNFGGTLFLITGDADHLAADVLTCLGNRLLPAAAGAYRSLQDVM